MKSVGEISVRVMANCSIFLLIIDQFDLDQGQGHRHLGQGMRINGLYLGTKYEVCR